MPSEWLPIETAPKDGDFLVVTMNGIRLVHSSNGFMSQHGDPYTNRVHGMYWMPLPAPPSEGASDAK